MVFQDSPPLTIVVMGVGGCGKSAFGALLAQSLGALFVEGDDFHTRTAIEKMRTGIPLDDHDREPWLRTLNGVARDQAGSTVIACSALKQRYRDILRTDACTEFLHLEITERLARQRLTARENHFFPVSLIESQFATLEPLHPSEAGTTLNGAAPLSELMIATRQYLSGRIDFAALEQPNENTADTIALEGT